MRYMLLIYSAENSWTDETRQACYQESAQLAQDLAKNGKFVSTAPLQSVENATTVSLREGRRVVTDGPFAETREQLGGYFMVNAKNLDEAIAIAERIPAARKGTVEIRPVVEVGGLPE